LGRSGVDGFELAMMLSVKLARLFGVVGGVDGMAGGDMGVMARGFGVARFMMGGGFAMMPGRHFVMVSGVGVVLVGLVSRGHLDILSGVGAIPTVGRAIQDDKPGGKTKVRRLE